MRSLMTLPDDLQWEVFEYCDADTLISLGSTCKANVSKFGLPCPVLMKISDSLDNLFIVDDEDTESSPDYSARLQQAAAKLESIAGRISGFLEALKPLSHNGKVRKSCRQVVLSPYFWSMISTLVHYKKQINPSALEDDPIRLFQNSATLIEPIVEQWIPVGQGLYSHTDGKCGYNFEKDQD